MAAGHALTRCSRLARGEVLTRGLAGRSVAFGLGLLASVGAHAHSGGHQGRADYGPATQARSEFHGPITPEMLEATRPPPTYALRLHVVRTTSNTGGDPATTATCDEYANAIPTLNRLYAPARISFVFDPVEDCETIHSQLLDYQYRYDDTQAALRIEDRSPNIDRRVHDDARRAIAAELRGKIVIFSSFGWVAPVWDRDQGIWLIDNAATRAWASINQWVSMPSTRRVSATTLAHELGHHLGLRHPHLEMGVATPEDGWVAGPSRHKAAETIRKFVASGFHPQWGLSALDYDRFSVSDTPADPGPGFWRAVTGENACGPTDEVDLPVAFPDGSTWTYTLRPDRNLLMSYFLCTSSPTFSREQIGVMRGVLEDTYRHHLVSAAAGGYPWRIGQAGSARAGAVQATDIDRVSLRRVVTTSVANGTLSITGWDVSTDGESVTRLGTAHYFNVEEASTSHMNNGVIATALRTASGRLEIKTHRLQLNGQFATLAGRIAGGADRIDTLKVGENYLVTGIRNDARNLEIIYWEIHGDGWIERVASAEAGAVDRVSLSAFGSRNVLSTVRNGHRALQAISWQFGGDPLLSRADSATRFRSRRVEATALQTDVTATAHIDGAASLVIDAWNVDVRGELVHVTEHNTGQYAGELDAERLGSDLLVTVTRSYGGWQRLNLFRVGDGEVQQLDSFHGQRGSSLSLARVNEQMVITAARGSDGNLELQVYAFDRLDEFQWERFPLFGLN